MKRRLLMLIVWATFLSLANAISPHVPIARADGFIDFENGVDGAVVSSTIPGLHFTTTEGYDWVYGDWRTGEYNGKYPNGAYTSNGNFFAWLGPNQGRGRIDFTQGGATYLSVWTSTYSGLVMDGYDTAGQLIATSEWAPANTNTGRLDPITVRAPAGQRLAYVIVHDTGNYWLIDDLTTDAPGVPNVRTPVIFIPGLGGTRLNNNEGEVWPNISRMYTSPSDDYLDVLQLAPNGRDPADPNDPRYTSVTTGDIIRRIGPLDFYGGFVDYLRNAGYNEGEKLWVFPYDWRKDLRSAAAQLDTLINTILTQTGSPQVNIVSHSLGGLVTRAYITDPSRAQKVEKAIILGTPSAGAAKAFKGLHYGDTFVPTWGPFGLNESKVKELVQNAPSAYQLLPSSKYFDLYDGGYFILDRDINGDGVPEGLLSYPATQALLYGEHNLNLVRDSEAFHAEGIDDWSGGHNGVQVFVIVGYGQGGTVGYIREYEKVSWFGFRREIKYDLIDTNGDGTVPLHSADLRNLARGKDFSGNANIYYTKVAHGDLVNKDWLRSFIKDILATPSLEAPGRPTAVDVLGFQSSHQIQEGGLLLPQTRWGSPASATTLALPTEILTAPLPLRGQQLLASGQAGLHVYDSQGSHTGPLGNDIIEMNVPGASYVAIGDTTSVFLPEDGTYTITMRAVGSGSVDLKLRQVENDLITRTILYKQIPITESTWAQLVYSTTATSPDLTLRVDQDGDGVVDANVSPTSILGHSESQDWIAPTTTIILDGIKSPDGRYISPVTVTLVANDNVGGSGVNWIEYSPNGGQTIARYSGPFVVPPMTGITILAKAIDRAGNEEYPLTRMTINPYKVYLPLILRGYLASWTSGIGLTHVTYGLALNPANCNIVYAATDAGLYKSTDGGTSWTSSGLNAVLAGRTLPSSAPRFRDAQASATLVSAVAVDPANSQVVYAATWGSGVYKSTNAGGSWMPVNSGLSDPYIYTIATDPGQSNIVYAGGDSQGVCKTTNGGTSWSASNSGLGNLNIRYLAVAPSDRQVIYAGTAVGVYRSNNGGASWNALGTLGSGAVWAIAIHPTNWQTVYAGLGGGGAYKSTNGGANWVAINTGLGSLDLRGLVIDPLNTQVLYAGTNGGGVFRSSDSATWTEFNTGLGNLTIKSLALSSGSCHTLLAGTADGVWRH